MNFYPFHPGDYMLRTAHLDLTEDLAYRRLLDLYYINEQPIQGNADAIARVIRMRSNVSEVAAVLAEFFVETDAGWQHSHCDQVIAQYQAKAKQAAENGKRGGRPRKADASQEQSQNNPEETQPVISANPEESGSKTNQEPITKTKEEQEQKALVPSGDDTSAYSAEFESFWAEYPKREGGNSKKGAFKAWNARLRSGVKAEDLILSAKRYADQMQAKGNVGTSFVKQAATFLGPDEHWREALASNIHPLRTTASGGVVKGDSRTCPPLTRKGDFEYWNAIENRWEVRNTETHDPATGYAWSYLKSRGQA